MSAVLFDNLLKVIDGIQEDIAQLAHLGLDVARDGNVDHEDRTVAAFLQRPLDHALAQDRQRCGGRGDHDVGLDERLGNGIEGNRLTAQRPGKGLGALAGAVGHGELPHTRLVEVARHQLDGLAGADQQRSRAGEVAKDTAGQAHRRIGHRHRVASDAGLGTHLLGHGKGVLKKTLQLLAQPLLSAAGLVGLLELAQYLRLAQHHRVQPYRHAHEVSRRLVLVEVVGAAREILHPQPVKPAQPVEDLALADSIGDAVELGTVAGGENRGLAYLRQRTQLGQRRLQLSWRKGDLFAHLDGGGPVVDSQGKKRHAFGVFASRGSGRGAVKMSADADRPSSKRRILPQAARPGRHDMP